MPVAVQKPILRQKNEESDLDKVIKGLGIAESLFGIRTNLAKVNQLKAQQDQQNTLFSQSQEDRQRSIDPSSPLSQAASKQAQKLGIQIPEGLRAGETQSLIKNEIARRAAEAKAQQQAANLGFKSREVALKEEDAQRKQQEFEISKKLTPAQKQIDTTFAKEYADFIAGGGVSNVQAGISTLDSALEGLKDTDTVTGPIVGRLPGKSFTNPKAVAVQDAVEKIVQEDLRRVLGAQFTEKEGERLIARSYNPSLQEGENIKRVSQLRNKVAAAAQAKLRAGEYLQEHGTLQGYEGTIFAMKDGDLVEVPATVEGFKKAIARDSSDTFKTPEFDQAEELAIKEMMAGANISREKAVDLLKRAGKIEPNLPASK